MKNTLSLILFFLFLQISISNILAQKIYTEAMVAYHEMPADEREKYNADWGATFFFQPKKIFSQKKDCKLITLYAEGKGIAMIFYLFDDATEEIDVQQYCFSFKEK